MSPRTVITHPNTLLRTPAELVDASDISSVEIQQLIDDLIETMKKENGIGIAAPQVGISKRVIIVDTGNGPEAFINPLIVSRSFRKGHFVEEGCLSVPGVWGYVTRNKSVKIRAFNSQGEAISRKVRDVTSVIFQHEIDHLDGVLFIDKVDTYTRHPRM